jgi:hypothetical protein
MSRATHQIKEKINKKLYQELQVAIEIQEDCQRKLGSIKTNKSGKVDIIQLTSDRRGANKKQNWS